MDERLQTQEDLERYFGRVFRPLTRDELDRFREAAKHLRRVNATDRMSIETMTHAIAKVKDADDRDMLRQEGANILVDSGAVDLALDVVEQIENYPERVAAHLLIAERLMAANELQNALVVLVRASELATKARSDDMWPWQRARLLNRVAEKLIVLEHEKEAFEVWEQAIHVLEHGLQDEDENIVLVDIACNLAATGYIDYAEQVAEMIHNPGRKAVALKSIAASQRHRR
jgi:tetratricopeptide (TPR) repeat protein